MKPSAAHPRACGENGTPLTAEEAREGSSPRVRGKLPRPDRRVRSHGLIPARAGKTPRPARSTACAWAHPRACGENAAIGSRLNFVAGSSPRVRGKHGLVPGGDEVAGLIPARAGKTAGLALRPRRPKAHPRACGENVREVSLTAIPAGSSPRVRGKRVSPSPHPPIPRLIPARAGKTPCRTPESGGLRAHPRACGENGDVLGALPGRAGSSPRVRGKPNIDDLSHHIFRLIPARAGKTHGAAVKCGHGAAHPRACGENYCHFRYGLLRPGSSPRVRGKL